MIDYATWCAIRDGAAQHLTPPPLARQLGLDVKTVRHWLERPYARRTAPPRASKLDPFKGRIVGWLDAQPLSAQQVYQRLCAAGYRGGVSIVKDYVRRIRPRPREAFLTLAFAPGDMAKVDWGDGGAIARGCPSSSWCWPTVVRGRSNSPWRRRWSTSWPRTRRPLRPGGSAADHGR